MSLTISNAGFCHIHKKFHALSVYTIHHAVHDAAKFGKIIWHDLKPADCFNRIPDLTVLLEYIDTILYINSLLGTEENYWTSMYTDTSEDYIRVESGLDDQPGSLESLFWRVK